MLLTGDMSADGEADLVRLESGTEGKVPIGTGSTDVRESGMKEEKAGQPEAGDIWILKVAHHGSGYSSSEAFLAWLNPDYAVISCGKKNRYGHPHPDTLERLSECESQILQTKESGAIIWQTDGHRITWTGWKTAREG